LLASPQILKRSWGEALHANFGIGIIVFLASLVCLIPLVLGVMALQTNLVFGIVGIAVGVVGLLIEAFVSSALDAIVMGALYLYAAEGTVPQQFNDAMFQKAFAHK